MFGIKTSANFEAAHRLSNYNGKCSYLHGHNWKVDLEIKSSVLNKQEMVFDFKNLKKALGGFDHKVLLKENSENQKISASLPKSWIKWLSFEPTAEQLAKYLCEKISKKLGAECIVVKVWENEKSFGEFEKKF
jgi:6-pyruvoyltetrahydropterin/6-carboxytetrahydropterin synthase